MRQAGRAVFWIVTLAWAAQIYYFSTATYGGVFTATEGAAIGAAGRAGQVAPGFRADLVLLAVRDWGEVPYCYGANFVREVWLGGVACPLERRRLNLAV